VSFLFFRIRIQPDKINADPDPDQGHNNWFLF
jgi:hypothetical protein